MMKKQIMLTWKLETTTGGNQVKNATIVGTLLRLSETVFSYDNASGDTLNYKLADIQFTDNNGVSFKKQGVVVYESSYSQGMELGENYLGRISRGTNEDGSARKPWATLSSYVAGDSFSEADFAEEEILDEITV
jgi:hypothetical protein